ncbi:MAG: Histidine N-alpha-methyltransferase [Stenotrophomonas maltophilia]|uniref:Histidine N-alpha-methyltransferase n=1 Tax=Stenotrophomonas maltophilia TaxID=40324 RepID=A0A7V8JLC0_STEMA|nr:MAG: Histidine N-alpha-methyltransferase [Stenotrophomonas maltophilia]
MHMPLPGIDTSAERDALRRRFHHVRGHSLALAAPLEVEDQAAQSMPDASPTKLHLAHTSWFFETFLLLRHLPGYTAFHPGFGALFNSYYEALGPRLPRNARGLLTRPSAQTVRAYRAHVDAAMDQLLQHGTPAQLPLVELGLAHEQQHQELIVMDALHLLSCSPLAPAYLDGPPPRHPSATPQAWHALAGGLVEIGARAGYFAFDNEGPRHSVYLQPYAIAERLVSNGEWLAFIAAGGYQRPQLWLADGWATRCAEGWQAPLYWQHDGTAWTTFGLHGRTPLDPAAPVQHVSYYEANAFACWAGARLPSEAEWEHAARTVAPLQGLYDQAWQWTSSSYEAYPSFRAAPDAVGEYNGKFMVGQRVLRGGAAATPPGHTRPSYRNFFAPAQRWLFSGVRLARDLPVDDAVQAPPSQRHRFADDVLRGLSATPKALPPKYFYDTDGSELFEALCATPEYYLTRTELAPLREVAPALAPHIAEGSVLVEFGSGVSIKTRVLLDAAPQLSAYVPIDISATALQQASSALRSDHPGLLIAPLVADFTTATALPAAADGRPRLGFFPGSTLGNFAPGDAVELLSRLRRLLGPGAQLLVGVDLLKDAAVLEAVYDDAAGATAAFNRNLLLRINRELGGHFDAGTFQHQARWNAAEQRIEMHLVSACDQHVQVLGRRIAFARGESIHTENAHKFTPATLAATAECAGWTLCRHWLQPDPAFGLFLLAAPAGTATPVDGEPDVA